jgi:sulfatase modifying factor 1
MASVFISYRRRDSAGYAGRLYDRLVKAFGSGHVFMDTEQIASGEDFAEAIDARIATCEVFLAVIGPRWLKAADEDGRRRLDAPDDSVRMEIAAGLSRGLLVIPVLVEVTGLPRAEALPGELVRLCELQAMELREGPFHQDVDRLLERIADATDQPKKLQEPSLPAGTIRVHPRDECEYSWIPPGQFVMGRVPGDNLQEERYDIEKPRHPVSISRGFWISRGPVTVAAYKRYAAARRIPMPRSPKDNPNWWKNDHPIVNVTWAQARDYCAWVGGRLPTEAQWEYAARGGIDGQIYPWGNDIDPSRANYSDNRDWQGTSPVGTFPAKGFSLYDSAGNVFEWVADWYDENLYATRSPHTATLDPQVYRSDTGKRVVRGGSWQSIPSEVRTSLRGFQTPNDGFTDFGFRSLVDSLPS